MANILFRESTTATIPASTSAKGSPLTNLELDGNFKSLNDNKVELSGTGATGTWDISITGNAGTVTNGFYTTSSFNLGTTSIAVNRVSGTQTLTGISIDGNAGSATILQNTRTINGVNFNGSANITITANTTNALSIGTGLTGTSFNGSTGVTIGIDNTVITTLTDTQTLTNKRINPRIVSAAATSGNLTVDSDVTDTYNALGLTGAIVMLQPSGTPVDGQKLLLRFEDNGTPAGITWTTTAGAFRAVGVTLPVTTVAGKVLYVGCIRNTGDGYWDVIATAVQA